MISKKQLSEFINRTKPKELKKYQFFEIKIRLGRHLYRNCFDYNLSLPTFERLIREYKKVPKQKEIKQEIYSKYYDKNRVLIVQDDGYSTCFEYGKMYTSLYQFKGKYESRLTTAVRNQLPPDNFPLKLEYDNIVRVEKITIPFDKKINLQFLKNEEESGDVNYQLSILIEWGADFEVVTELVKKLQKIAN